MAYNNRLESKSTEDSIAGDCMACQPAFKLHRLSKDTQYMTVGGGTRLMIDLAAEMHNEDIADRNIERYGSSCTSRHQSVGTESGKLTVRDSLERTLWAVLVRAVRRSMGFQLRAVTFQVVWWIDEIGQSESHEAYFIQIGTNVAKVDALSSRLQQAVTHEVVKPTARHTREERIQREIHNHEVYERIQPVYDIEVLPPRHFVPDSNGEGLIEVLEINSRAAPGRAKGG
ncbi:uncharacterized protein BDR25DRAFT_313262 [Lindgomyces ingoldianus]|uniref:Uncharacterized protein n=1 Tax=Lindgomyces ingoldianus TaxID=673940 RepID=A0ACB6R158_9PLEO|nr:uncharacterized protein BDR25DRAFT_313262 [Lindgomyces ingoldianus]KAF2472057.1 hypothetical protein BDR25DRAFT_313262 [Lindgomyces ingoldianus]